MAIMTGSCLCGKIRYQVTQLVPQMAHCHCSMCRKFHGAAFATYGEAKAENFRWLSGEHLLQQYQAENGTLRQFCRDCGSSLSFSSAKADGRVIEFSLATLDCDIDARPDAHIFVENKVNWYQISDRLLQFKQARE